MFIPPSHLTPLPPPPPRPPPPPKKKNLDFESVSKFTYITRELKISFEGLVLVVLFQIGLRLIFTLNHRLNISLRPIWNNTTSHFVVLFTYLWRWLHKNGSTSGPGCSKLTTSLVNISLKFQMFISKICQYFYWKNMRSFCIAKASLIFATKNIRLFIYKVVKHFTSWPLNELVKLTMLWTTGPRPTSLYISCLNNLCFLQIQFTNVIRLIKGEKFGQAGDHIVGVGAHYDTADNSPGNWSIVPIVCVCACVCACVCIYACVCMSCCYCTKQLWSCLDGLLIYSHQLW